jgi:Tol biopolymer transport system component
MARRTHKHVALWLAAVLVASLAVTVHESVPARADSGTLTIGSIATRYLIAGSSEYFESPPSVDISGGAPPYTVTVTGGQLPQGVTLNSDGSLAGAPAAVGQYRITVDATDVNGVAGTGSVTINVGTQNAVADQAAGSQSPSADGSRVAFSTASTSLYPSAPPYQVLVLDRTTNAVMDASTDSAGVPSPASANSGASWTISANGRFVLIASDNWFADGEHTGVWLKDLQTGALQLVQALASGYSGIALGLSDDGNVVAYAVDDGSGVPNNVQVTDIAAGTTIQPNLCPGDRTLGNALFRGNPLTPDGRYLIFNDFGGDCLGNSGRHTVLYDRTTGTSIDVANCQCNTTGRQLAPNGSVSADGRYVAYYSDSQPGYPTGVFRLDRTTGAVTALPAPPSFVLFFLTGAQISADGQRIATRPNTGIVCLYDVGETSQSCLQYGSSASGGQIEVAQNGLTLATQFLPGNGGWRDEVVDLPPPLLNPAWEITSSPQPSGWNPRSTQLGSVSCVSASMCAVTAVNGAAQSQASASIWNGQSWSTTEFSQFEARLNGVSCAAVDFCTAVGSYRTSSASCGGSTFIGILNAALVEHWDGATWSQVTLPTVDCAGHVELQAISCPSTTFCMAAGTSLIGEQPPYAMLTEVWDGVSWSIAPSSPLPTAGPSGFGIQALSCPATNACASLVVGNNQTYLFLWDGTTWSVGPSPTFTKLDMSCRALTNCLTVGSSGGAAPAVAQTWNGTTWAPTAAPPDSTAGYFSGVSCVSSTTCEAVGTFATTGTSGVVADQWDGNNWTSVPNPRPSSWSSTALERVSCPTVSFCMAIGYSIGPDAAPLTEVLGAIPPPPDRLSLTATPSTQDVGSHSVLLATLRTSAGQPVPSTLVRFQVTSGPDTGFTDNIATDSTGTAGSLLRGKGGGVDDVQAWVDSNSNGVADPGEPVATATVTWTTPCTGYDAVVLGVRGSGDNNHQGYNNDFPGRHTIAIASLLRTKYHLRLYDDDLPGSDRAPHNADGVIGIRYQAVDVLSLNLLAYNTSVNSGVAELLSQIDRIRQGSLCGAGLPILLVGHSQGAQIIQSALEKLDDAAATGDTTWTSIGGAALLASPRFDNGDPAGRGTYVADHPSQGIAGHALVRARFSSATRPLTRSYCLDNDPVCVFTKVNLALETVLHTHTNGYNDCNIVPNPCQGGQITTPSGVAIANDVAGLLAWDVAHRSGADVPPVPGGALMAYRQSLVDSVRVSAAAVYANGAPTTKFRWDFNGDGVVDLTSNLPYTTHTYGVAIRGTKQVQTRVMIDHADGAATTATICIRRVSVGGVTC